MHAPQVHPTTERSALVDALRGLALLSIALANVPTGDALKSTHYIFLNSQAINPILEAAKHILISTKFITLFSILFGYGFYTQLNRATQWGTSFRRYFTMRMLLLLIIGCLHAYLLWFGDIIRYYALCGMALLVFHQLSTRKLLITALVFMVPVTAILFILNGLLELQRYSYDYTIPDRIIYETSYLNYLRDNFTIDPMVNFVQDSPITFAACFGKILFGYWLGRISFFQQPQRFGRMLKKWFWWGLSVGTFASVGYWAVSTGRLTLDLPLLWLPFVIAGGLVLHSLFYIAAFVRVFQTQRGKRVLLIFAPLGKMALTNYLLQTVFYLLFFYAWPHAWPTSQRISLAEVYLLTLLFYGLQVLFSHWWLRYFSQGPVEFLWKKMAYRQLGPGDRPASQISSIPS
ncbi:DUF418 domain-containing protein [Spirosoma linguale]